MVYKSWLRVEVLKSGVWAAPPARAQEFGLRRFGLGVGGVWFRGWVVGFGA